MCASYGVFLIMLLLFFFFSNNTATTEIYTLSLHDALPISARYGSLSDENGTINLRWTLNALNGPPLLTVVWEERSEEHTSELQSLRHLVCRLLLEKKKKKKKEKKNKKKKTKTYNTNIQNTK